jgi:hypothetical protein
MKKLILVIAVLASSVVPAHAATPETIVVIDNGTNTSLFPNNIAYEVCLVSTFKCPNGTSFMEGTGAANLPTTKDKQFNHGTQMISVLLRTNPSAQIIPIRIVGMTPNGLQSLYSLDDVQKALNWVVANRVKFNISAVSVAQGRIFAGCKVPEGMSANITALKAAQVPVFAAAGNDGNKTAVFSPACLSDAISVGATDNPWPGMQPIEYDKNATPTIARYSNGAVGQVDFYLNGRYNATMLNGTTKFTVGTSNATAALAGWWLLNKKDTYDATLAAIQQSTIEISGNGVSGRYVRLP